MCTQVGSLVEITSNTLWFDLSPLSNAARSCGSFINVTPHEGIIYVSSTERLTKCRADTVTYNLTVAAGGAARHSLLKIALRSNDSLQTNVATLGKVPYMYNRLLW